MDSTKAEFERIIRIAKDQSYSARFRLDMIVGRAEAALYAQGEAALGRAEPVAWHGTWQTRTSKWTEVFETEAQATNWAINKEGAVINPLFFSATPPAPQPALALIEELERALISVRGDLTRREDLLEIQVAAFRTIDTALASAKRFKGE